VAKKQPKDWKEELALRREHPFIPVYIHKEDLDKMIQLIEKHMVSLGNKDMLSIRKQAKEAALDICYHLYRKENIRKGYST
jgi:hypothetical protein